MSSLIVTIIWVVFVLIGLLILFYAACIMIAAVSGLIYIFSSILCLIGLIKRPWAEKPLKWSITALIIFYIFRKLEKVL